MTYYDDLHRAVLNGTVGQEVTRWAFDVLADIARDTTGFTAMRHPLGFVCIPIERSGDQGVCVHVWSDSFPSADLTTSAMHAHSWDLISHVLYGSVCNKLIDVIDAPDNPTHRVFEVCSGGDVDEVRETARLVRYETIAAELNRQGDTYSVPAGMFHATEVQGEVATVALGSNRSGGKNLSLGGINIKSHQVRRSRFDLNGIAATARVVIARLASIHLLNQKD